ncbi:MAG: ATP-binding cassette domain-containing protein [Clostridia bacterium]|nr:ATP-binding cassette domain-containing protein [Clostridia bacterium]MBQ6704071.1 ATP-binding cassette domain-containing protein [Clostridia bacterium]
MSLLTCENAALAYDGRVVVSGLDFSVEQGDLLCITGENGAGKSTLIKGLLGLIKPSSGRIYTGDGLRHAHIGYLPQQNRLHESFPASVEEVVLSGCLNSIGHRPFYSKAQKQRAAENMARLGLSSIAGQCYGELSGGQQRRVLLARALCATHRLLLLDEPASGLDPIVTGELYRIISRLNSADGITVIMVSHDIPAAAAMAKHMLHLGGSGLFYGTPEEYRRTPVGAAFLGGGA